MKDTKDIVEFFKAFFGAEKSLALDSDGYHWVVDLGVPVGETFKTMHDAYEWYRENYDACLRALEEGGK